MIKDLTETVKSFMFIRICFHNMDNAWQMGKVSINKNCNVDNATILRKE